MVGRHTVQGRPKVSKAVACVTVRKFRCPMPCAASRSRASTVYKSSPGHFQPFLLHLCSANISLNSKSKIYSGPIHGCLFSAQSTTSRDSCSVRSLLLLKFTFKQRMGALPLSSLNQNPGFYLSSVQKIIRAQKMFCLISSALKIITAQRMVVLPLSSLVQNHGFLFPLQNASETHTCLGCSLPFSK